MLRQEIELIRKEAEHWGQYATFQEWKNIERSGSPHPTYDSLLHSYNITLRPVLPSGRLEVLAEQIRQKQKNGSTGLRGLELMGPGSQLFAGFPPGLFRETAGLTLRDWRSPQQQQKDEERHHTVLERNILSPDLSQAIRQWSHGKPIDLIIFRPVAGIVSLPANEYILFQKLNEIYSTLALHGSLVAEIPPVFIRWQAAWRKHLRATPGLHVHFPKEKYVIRIDKESEDAPLNLPSLPLKTILKEARWYRDLLQERKTRVASNSDLHRE